MQNQSNVRKISAGKIRSNLENAVSDVVQNTVSESSTISERLWSMPRYPTISIPTGKSYKPELQIAGENKSSILLGNRQQLNPPTTQYRHSSSPKNTRKNKNNTKSNRSIGNHYKNRKPTSSTIINRTRNNQNPTSLQQTNTTNLNNMMSMLRIDSQSAFSQQTLPVLGRR